TVLMDRLGYGRFGAQGGDWGAGIAGALAARHPDRLVGIHLNMVTAPLGPDTGDLTPRERAAVDDYAHTLRDDSAAVRLQRTRPQTLGYGLVDSPAMQCAWIVEKVRAWSDCDGDVLAAFDRDELLDNVMAYWLTATGASA